MGGWRQEDIGTCCVLFSLARAPPAWALTTGAGCCRDQLPLLRSCAQSGQGFKRSQECGPVIQKSANWESIDKNQAKEHHVGSSSTHHLADGLCLGKGGPESQCPVYHHRCLLEAAPPHSSALWSAFPRTTRRRTWPSCWAVWAWAHLLPSSGHKFCIL